MATYSVQKMGGTEVSRFSYLEGAKAACDAEAEKSGEHHFVVKQELVWSSALLDAVLQEETSSERHSPIKFDR